MSDFTVDGFPWSQLPPTWHDPQTPAGGTSPLPGRHALRNTATPVAINGAGDREEPERFAERGPG